MDNFNIHKFFKNQYLNEGVNDNITKSNISNLDYDAIKYIFPEISTSNRISFPNPDDSLTGVGNERDWEDWKKNTMKRYGDVELEMDPNNSMWFRRVKINDDKFKKDKDQFIKGKQSFIDREQSLGRSIDEDRKAKEYIKSIEDEDERESERKRMFGDDEYEKKERDIDTIKMMHPKTDTNALRQIVKDLVAKKKKGIPPNARFTDVDEGTCGYSVDGKGGDKPAGSHLLKKDDLKENTRTRELADSYSLAELKSRLSQIYRDMEEEAEPEGGPIADQYADEIDAYEKAIRLKKGDSGREMTYGDMLHKTQPDKYGPGGTALNEATDDEVAQAEFGMDYDQLGPGEKEWVRDEIDNQSINESTDLERLKHFRDNLDDMMYDAGYSGDWILKIKTILRGIIDSKLIESKLNESEKSWNAVDVSRTAEKELSNKEWNERTAKKLEMLMKLNAAGKFKKDFDEERLQGWVDQNYSWEKLSRQFKLNESKNWSEKFKPLKEKLNSIEKSLPKTMKSSGRINREES